MYHGDYWIFKSKEELEQAEESKKKPLKKKGVKEFKPKPKRDPLEEAMFPENPDDIEIIEPDITNPDDFIVFE